MRGDSRYHGAMKQMWLMVVLGVVGLGVACGGGDGLGPDSTPRPTLPPIATRPPEATATPVNAYPRGTRTNVRVIDDVLAALEAGDAAGFEAQLSFHPYPCDNAPAGTEASNPCPPGVRLGSPVDVIASGGCQASFIARGGPELNEEVEEFVTAAAKQGLYAASEVKEGRLSSDLPLRYLVVLSGGFSLLLDDGGVTHLGLPCDAVGPAELYHPADRPILPPL
jgi:hypothetical protein